MTDGLDMSGAPVEGGRRGALAGLGGRLQIQGRALAGLAVIGLLVWIYAIMLMTETTGALQAEIDRLQNDLYQREATLSDGRWERRRRDSAALLLAAEGRLWRGATMGLARAEFQKWLNGAVARSGLKGARIRFEQSPAAGRIVPEATAVITAAFAPGPLFRFLATLNDNPRQVIVKALEVKTAGAARLSMVVGAPLRITAPAGGRK
jgi:hypothetical protein